MTASSLLARCDFPDGPVHLAVSGGPDSLALLVLATAAGLDTTAIHVEHGLRAGSAAEAELVAAAAAHFGARFERRTVSVAPGPNLEARARHARYSVLPDGVLTGHTMDDQAETVLLNLLWGAGLDGLAGIRNIGTVRRPLLSLRRHETEALCSAYGLEPVRDPSNTDLRFRRNRIRHQVIPLLCDVSGRDVVPVLARQAELLADEARLLDDLAGALDPTDAKALRSAPVPLARRAIRSWLRRDHPPSAGEVARVLSVVAGAATACELAGGRRVARSRGRLALAGD